VSIDTLRPERLGVYGNTPDVSPHIDALARRAVVFDQALAPSPWTLPSHMTMLTGLDPVVHGVGSERQALSRSVVTLAERLRARGFRTGGFTDARFLDADYGFGRGFDVYEDERASRGPNGFARLLPRVRAWTAACGDAPYFLFVHTFDVHARYDDTDPEVLKRFRRRPAPDGPLDHLLAVTRHLYLMRKMGVQRYGRLSLLLNDYDAGVHVADRGVGAIVELLDESGRLDDALLIVVSDHGESFLDHGPFVGHGLGLTDDEIAIPLVVKFPGDAGADTRLAEPVDLLDIAPTILEAAGLTSDAALPGESLWRRLRGAPPRQHPVYGMSSNTASYYLVEDGYKYISPLGMPADEVIRTHLGPQTPPSLAATHPGDNYAMGGVGEGVERRYDFDADPLGLRDAQPETARLFDRRDDPRERVDVAGRERERALRMRARLVSILDRSRQLARALPDDGGHVTLDDAQREQLAQLGYLTPPEGERLQQAPPLAPDPPRRALGVDARAWVEHDRAVHRIRMALLEQRALPPDAANVLQAAAAAYTDWQLRDPRAAQRALWRLRELHELARHANLPLDAASGSSSR
jgi:arylsulfatase A-like enzyme